MKFTPKQKEILEIAKAHGFVTIETFMGVFSSPIARKANIERFADIINYVKGSCELNKIYPSYDMILDCAVRIYNSQSFKGKESVNENELPKASDKQIAYLIQLGYEGNTELNIQEAKDLITKLKEAKRLKK
jgi:hypothetical protein